LAATLAVSKRCLCATDGQREHNREQSWD
jgi:hypothetical protein